MKTSKLPDVEYLKECFLLDEEGRLVWKSRPRSHFKSNLAWKIFEGLFPGTPAGCVKSDGYLAVVLNKKTIRSHRIIFSMSNGVDPLDKIIDHINGNKLDNRPENLRIATVNENAQNRCTIQKNNTSGELGVTWNRKCSKWQVALKHNGKCIYLGVFKSKEEASLVSKSARIKLFGEFSRHFNERNK